MHRSLRLARFQGCRTAVPWLDISDTSHSVPSPFAISGSCCRLSIFSLKQRSRQKRIRRPASGNGGCLFSPPSPFGPVSALLYKCILPAFSVLTPFDKGDPAAAAAGSLPPVTLPWVRGLREQGREQALPPSFRVQRRWRLQTHLLPLPADRSWSQWHS